MRIYLSLFNKTYKKGMEGRELNSYGTLQYSGTTFKPV